MSWRKDWLLCLLLVLMDPRVMRLQLKLRYLPLLLTTPKLSSGSGREELALRMSNGLGLTRSMRISDKLLNGMMIFWTRCRPHVPYSLPWKPKKDIKEPLITMMLSKICLNSNTWINYLRKKLRSNQHLNHQTSFGRTVASLQNKEPQNVSSWRLSSW